MRQAQTFEFNFKNVEKQYESYQGINVKLRCAVFIYQRKQKCIPYITQVLRASIDLEANGGCEQGERHMGPLIPNASRQQ
jgi:vacuolar protein sorting-associated protein 26